MTLTPQQRIEAYRYAIAYYKGAQFRFSGICAQLYAYAIINLNIIIFVSELWDVFPEVRLLRPLNTGAYWFQQNEEGKQQRIELLHKAIQLAEKAEV